jgi:Transposase DDE domain group 1
MRLVLHTAAYWLLLTVLDATARPHPLATAEFTMRRMRLLKIAGRITETPTRVRIAFVAACPDAALFRRIAVSLQPAGRETRGARRLPPTPNAFHQPD